MGVPRLCTFRNSQHHTARRASISVLQQLQASQQGPSARLVSASGCRASLHRPLFASGLSVTGKGNQLYRSRWIAVVLVGDLIRLPLFELVAPAPAEMDAVYAAFVAFGKGRGHAVDLNFGDVFSYALAKVRVLPLLSKGDDFARTDIASAVDVMHMVSHGAQKS